MKNASRNKIIHISFFAVVALSIVVIAFYLAYPKENNKDNTSLSITSNQTGENSPIPTITPSAITTPSPNIKPNNSLTSPTPTAKPTQPTVPKEETKKEVSENSTPVPTKSSVPASKATENTSIKILKNDINSVAKFYSYKIDDTPIEVIAVKADDGTIRTAFNTCQVCYDSGRGYYKQVGKYLVCQNCKNKFSINEIEQVKGGCNPVPILSENKVETKNEILISQEYLKSQKSLFAIERMNDEEDF